VYLDEEATTLAYLSVFVRVPIESCSPASGMTLEVGDLPDVHVTFSLLTGRNLTYWAWPWEDSGQDPKVRVRWEASAGRIALTWDGACRYEGEEIVSQGHLAVTLEDVTLAPEEGWASEGRIRNLVLPEVELLDVPHETE